MLLHGLPFHPDGTRRVQRAFALRIARVRLLGMHHRRARLCVRMLLPGLGAVQRLSEPDAVQRAGQPDELSAVPLETERPIEDGEAESESDSQSNDPDEGEGSRGEKSA